MIIHGSRRVRNGIGVMRAQTVQTTVVVSAGHYRGNGCRASACPVRRTSSCRGIHCSGSCSMYGTSSYRGVHRSSGKLRRASVYSVGHTRSGRGFHFSSSSSVCYPSSCRGVHRSSAIGKLCCVSACMQCLPHQLLPL